MVIDLENLSAYNYELPAAQIAQRPMEPRDASRLLVIDRKKGTWEHKIFRDFPDYIEAQSLLVANNSKVIPARLLGRRLLEKRPGQWELGGKIEFLLLEEVRPLVWEGAFHAAAKHKPGVRFEIPTPDGKGVRGIMVRGASESPSGTVLAEFDRDPVESGAGEIPLPHYIERSVDERDHDTYQTIYARQAGSAAAPTAGLHFTDAVMSKLQAKNVAWREVTLHVGLGTFRPVKVERVGEHTMHEERYSIDQVVADEITTAKKTARPVIAVGTTSVRTLESAWLADNGGKLRAGPGRTSIFIRPGHYEFKVVDQLLTNFHLPGSTLLMLVCAFAGHELMMAAYREAVREGYRFFSYGDAMLIK
jgi:S-adenosylmethionine:tRNA ribosyltransferase-isomerase